VYFNDACQVRADTLPGGNLTNFNLGTITVHEVGHWFGLLHPFDGADCNIDGDGIPDTPRQRTPSQDPRDIPPGQVCPITKDTCPLDPGLDNFTNYMDYAPNVCQVQFTPNQIGAMNGIFRSLRLGN
jgi:hypothetical protein